MTASASRKLAAYGLGAALSLGAAVGLAQQPGQPGQPGQVVQPGQPALLEIQSQFGDSILSS